jgi:competence ComEA-like helix-hairpin-helix protein
MMGLFAAWLGVSLWMKPVKIEDPLPSYGDRQHEVRNRVDPNRAGWAELAALPGIGPQRAKDIVAWREAFEQAHPGERAFQSADDLAQVKGIGSATVRGFSQWLVFEK